MVSMNMQLIEGHIARPSGSGWETTRKLETRGEAIFASPNHESHLESEPNPRTQLDVSRTNWVRLAAQRTKTGGVGEARIVIEPLVMVQNVSEDTLEFQ